MEDNQIDKTTTEKVNQSSTSFFKKLLLGCGILGILLVLGVAYFGYSIVQTNSVSADKYSGIVKLMNDQHADITNRKQSLLEYPQEELLGTRRAEFVELFSEYTTLSMGDINRGWVILPSGMDEVDQRLLGVLEKYDREYNRSAYDFTYPSGNVDADKKKFSTIIDEFEKIDREYDQAIAIYEGKLSRKQLAIFQGSSTAVYTTYVKSFNNTLSSISYETGTTYPSTVFQTMLQYAGQGKPFTEWTYSSYLSLTHSLGALQDQLQRNRNVPDKFQVIHSQLLESLKQYKAIESQYDLVSLEFDDPILSVIGDKAKANQFKTSIDQVFSSLEAFNSLLNQALQEMNQGE